MIVVAKSACVRPASSSAAALAWVADRRIRHQFVGRAEARFEPCSLEAAGVEPAQASGGLVELLRQRAVDERQTPPAYPDGVSA
jgi:hypothetical protein